MKQRKTGRRVLTALAVILTAAAVFFGLFFVTDAEVVGNTRYTEEQIREMTLRGPLSCNTILMSVFRSTVYPEAAFIESVHVGYRGRNTLRLDVQEKYPIGYIRVDGAGYYFDKNGLVLEAIADADAENMKRAAADSSLSTSDTSDSQDASSGTAAHNSSDTTFRPALTDVPLIVGLDASNVQVGQTISVGDPSVFQTILSLTKLIDKFSIQPDYVEFADDYTMTLHYGKVRIQIGSDDFLEEKISRVAAILPELDGLSGVLHLEDYTKDTQNIIFDRDRAADAESDG